MKKTFFVIIALFLLHATAQSQDVISKTTIDTVSGHGEHEVGWIRSHIYDNWSFSLQGGGNLYLAYQDFKGPLLDHLGGNVELHLGRWLFPMVGIRGNIGLGRSNGFITKESYLANRGELIKDYGNCEGSSTTSITSGNDIIKGALGGYYWTMDDNTDLFHQKWNYVYLGADLVVNLSFMKPFSRINMEQKWNHIVYAGYHIRVGLSENNPEKFSNFIGMSTSPAFKGFKNTNFANEGHIGYIFKYSLTNHINFHADARLSLIEGDFDRERLPGVELISPDLDFSAMVGLTYDFNFRSDKDRHDYYIEEGIIPYNTVSMPKFISYVQVEDLDVIMIVDTIFTVNYDTINDSVIITRYNDINTHYHAVNDWLSNYIPPTATLDSILMKRLLPYEMVFFDRDKWFIRDREEMKIAKMARLMKAYPDNKFLLYGSADSKTGTPQRNEFLSHNRADVVYDRLVNEYGIPPEQLERIYLGGILDYDPFILNRTTVIIMDHPVVKREFEKMKAQRKAGGNVVEFE